MTQTRKNIFNAFPDSPYEVARVLSHDTLKIYFY